MGHWPKTVGGKLIVLVIGVMVGSVLVQLAVAVSGGPFIWISLAAGALAGLVLTIWRRRVQTAHDLAVVDAPSFADALRARNARDAL